MSIDITNPDLLVTTFVNVFTVDHILAFLSLFFTYTGINGILIRDRNKYLNLFKVNFPELKAFSKKLYKYKLFIRVAPILIIPLSFILGLYIYIYLVELTHSIFLHSSVSSIINPYKYIGDYDPTAGLLLFDLYISSCFIPVSPALYIFLLYILGYRMIKTKNILPQNVTNFSEINYSLIFTYIFFWVILVILIMSSNFAFISPLIIEGGYGSYSPYLLPIYIIAYYFIIDLIKNIVWFNTKVPKMLIESFKLDFPPMKIKTSVGEVVGQVKGSLKNLYNPNFMTLIEGDESCFIPWDEVKIIKFSCNNQSLTQESIEVPGVKKKWWQIWR